MSKWEVCKDNVDVLKKILLEELDKEGTEQVTYQNWVSTDRTTLNTVVEKINEFVDEYVTDLIYLKGHDFIAAEQQKHLEEIKNGLTKGEFLILMDPLKIMVILFRTQYKN